jgi:hypothetical protein
MDRTSLVIATLLMVGACDNGGHENSCDLPSCLSSVLDACRMDSPCVVQTDQTDPTLYVVNMCFANGVTESVAMTAVVSGSSTATATVKRNGSVCYLTQVVVTGGASVATISNSSGKVVGTISTDIASGETSFACAGGPTVVISPLCSDGGSGRTISSSSCSQGSCAP